MEWWVHFATEHVESAQWIFFVLIMLAGLSVPISEDIVLITAGALAGTCGSAECVSIFILVFVAAWVAAWEAYWIGRILGPKLFQLKWFSHILPPHRLERLHYYYEKHGILIFFVVRFIPGGVRNAFFMTSGMGKMPFVKFIARDFPACLLSASFLFALGYLFGINSEAIIQFFKTTHTIAFAVALGALILYLGVRWYKRKRCRDF